MAIDKRVTDGRAGYGGKTVHGVFWTWGDWVEAAKVPARSSTRDAGRDPSRDDWAGGSYVEAMRMAVEGWNVGLPEVDRMASRIAHTVIADALTPTWTFPRDVTGEAIDMGGYLSGEPECWVTPVVEEVERQAGVVRVVVPFSFSAHVPESEIRARGVAMVALVEALHRAGNGVEVWAYQGVIAGSYRHRQHVLVQNASDPVDMGRIMFALAHPTMLRRLCFAVEDGNARQGGYLNGVEGKGLIGGYGSPDGTPTMADLPELEGPTIIVPAYSSRDDWSEDGAVRWIESALATLER